MIGFKIVVLVIFLAGCDDGAKTDEEAFACETVSSATLDEVDVSEWPVGLSEALGAYEAMDGEWTVDVSCPDAVSTANVQIEIVDREAIELRQVEGEGCDASYTAVTETPVTFTGWSEGELSEALQTGMGTGSMDYVRIEGGSALGLLVQARTDGSVIGTVTVESSTESAGQADDESLECSLENWLPA